MARGKAHDPELKAKVQAALATGQQPASVAKEFNLDKSLVSRWGKEIPQVLAKRPEAATNDLGTILEDHIVKLLLAMNAQLKKFGDEAWLHKQGAHDMAILFGVEQDKLVRLLGARQRGIESAEALRAAEAKSLPSVHAERPEDPDER